MPTPASPLLHEKRDPSFDCLVPPKRPSPFLLCNLGNGTTGDGELLRVRVPSTTTKDCFVVCGFRGTRETEETDKAFDAQGVVLHMRGRRISQWSHRRHHVCCIDWICPSAFLPFLAFPPLACFVRHSGFGEQLLQFRAQTTMTCAWLMV